jgi:predicted lipoprotein
MRALAALLAPLALVLGACSSPESSAPPDDTSGEGVELPGGGVFTRAGLLASIGTCVVGETATFATASTELASSAAADEGSDGASSDDTRAAWRVAMHAWQRIEVMQIGPQADATQPGGKDLREPIYAWPLESPCAVDETLVSQEYADIGALLVNARGLATIEYLAFHDTADNACTPQATINASGSWAALDAAELEARRKAYATAAAADVAQLGASLAELWRPEGGNFAGDLAAAGNGSATYPKVRLALNAISDALFYIEYATKDLKVARPAGLTLCPNAACPELVESPWAGASKDSVIDDLQGFQRIFDGCDAEGKQLGFDDFLYAVGRPEVAADIDAAVIDALAAAAAIEEPDLASALETDQASVVALHAALKRISDLLRTELISVLDLELPKRVEGDND